jgi:hypothetical protein
VNVTGSAQRSTLILAVLLAAGTSRAGEVTVTGIKAFHRDGQTFVTWKDAAKGETGAKYRYSVYRSDAPITQANVARIQPVIRGILNNSCKLPGMNLILKDRLDPELCGEMKRFRSYLARAESRITLPGSDKCLPMWSGVGVHTVKKPGKNYYAVVATDLELKPLSKVIPGQNATTEPVEEKISPVQPIKQILTKKGGVRKGKTPKGLPLYVSLHASCGSKARVYGMPGGDGFVYFPPKKEMGWRAGQPGIFGLSEKNGKHPHLLLSPRDTMTLPCGKTGVESLWFGLWCKPNWATDPVPRAYPFSDQRVEWLVNWVVKNYGADPNRMYVGGQSMGAYGTLNIGLHRPHLFAALYPTGPKCRMNKLYGLKKDGTKQKLYLVGPTPEKKLKASCLRAVGGKPPMMPDGKTEYFDHLNMVSVVEKTHADLPFVCFIGGRNKGNDWKGVDLWGDTVPMVKALAKNRHGFAFGWDDGNHGSAKKQFRKLCEYYPWHRFARNLSYPAFSNSSIDDDMGPDGPKEGYVNVGFVWTDPVDEADKWETTISNAEARGDMTVDVTPRRCQKFKVKPGEKLKWKSSAGNAGIVTANKWVLVTVEKVKIPHGKKVSLSITR